MKKYFLFVCVAVAPFLAFSVDVHDPGYNPPNLCDPTSSVQPGCIGDKPDLGSRPSRSTYFCYARAGGKTYGPGRESRSLQQAKNSVLGACKQRSKKSCSISQCYRRD